MLLGTDDGGEFFSTAVVGFTAAGRQTYNSQLQLRTAPLIATNAI